MEVERDRGVVDAVVVLEAAGLHGVGELVEEVGQPLGHHEGDGLRRRRAGRTRVCERSHEVLAAKGDLYPGPHGLERTCGKVQQGASRVGVIR